MYRSGELGLARWLRVRQSQDELGGLVTSSSSGELDDVSVLERSGRTNVVRGKVR